MSVEYRRRRALAAILCAGAGAVTLLAAAAPAPSAVPGANGRIAFAIEDLQCNNFCTFARAPQVATVAPDGTGERRVTAREWGAWTPAWSPDGSQIAFAGCATSCSSFTCGFSGCATSDIYVVKADGSGERKVTDDPSVQDSEPAWSPDGNRIAYSRNDGRGYDLYTIPAAGGTPQQVTALGGDEVRPDWSPDGTLIAFTTGPPFGHGTGIDVVRPDGTGLRQVVADDVRGVSWSADGRRLAYSALGAAGTWHIWVVDVDGGHAQVVPTASIRGVTNPSWSPDGTMLAFGGDDGSCTRCAELFTMAVDGTGQTRRNDFSIDFGLAVDEPDWGRGGPAAPPPPPPPPATPPPANDPPTARFTFAPAAPHAGEDVGFDASGSTDPDDGIASWLWDFGDGGTSGDAVAVHTYAAAGTYRVVLTVTDHHGASTTTSTDVAVAARLDTTRPSVVTRAVATRASKFVRLSFRADDDSGVVSVTLVIRRGSRAIARATTAYFQARGVATMRVRAPRAGAYRYCATARDRSGNVSAPSCSRLLLRR